MPQTGKGGGKGWKTDGYAGWTQQGKKGSARNWSAHKEQPQHWGSRYNKYSSFTNEKGRKKGTHDGKGGKGPPKGGSGNGRDNNWKGGKGWKDAMGKGGKEKLLCCDFRILFN